MIEYFYNEKSMILEIKGTGIVNINDIISHYEKIARDDSLPRNLKILINGKGVRFDSNIDDLNLATNTIKNALTKYNYIKEAILVDKPFTTVVAMLFQKMHAGFETYNFRVFSTEKAARYWLIS